jgi:iron complex outermembrane receptor protein
MPKIVQKINLQEKYSMNKNLSIMIILLLFLSLRLLYSQNDSIPEYRLSEIVVLGDRLPTVETISVYEIEGYKVDRLDAKNAKDAINYIPGLYFSLSTKNETTFRLRGFEQRQVQIYLDGVPISLPYDGLLDISQLAGDNFESIRVAKGASSVLYGANTLGGTINVITAFPSREFSYKVRSEGSPDGKIFSNLLLSGSIQRLRCNLSLSLDKSPDYSLPGNVPFMNNEDGGDRNNSAYRKQNGSLKIQYTLNQSNRIGAHLNFIDNQLDVPPNALVERPRYWKFPEWKKNTISLNTEHIFTDHFLMRSIWFYDNYHNILESYDDNTYTTQTQRYAFTSIYDDYSLGGIIYPHFSWSPDNITHGIISYKKDIHREKADLASDYSKYSTHILTIGAEHEVNFYDGWKAIFGVDGNYLKPLAAEDLSLRDPIFLINAQATGRYLSRSNWEIHGSLGRKTRFPTMKELYSERLGRNIPNPDLQYEQSLNLELGGRWINTAGYVESSIFQHFLTDYIVNIQIGEGMQQYQNVGKVLSRGFEIDIQQKWKPFDISANYIYLQTRNKTTDRTSKYLEYRPSHQFHGLLYFTPVTKLLIGIEAGYFADQYYQNPDHLNWEKLNNYGVLNVKGEWSFLNHFAIYLRVNNLLDTFYYSEYGIPMPGREFLFGIKING